MNDSGAGPLGVLGPAAGDLANVESREWLIPELDETFRSVYTRAGIGSTEMIGVSSAIQGEGKTTVSLGLAVTIALDHPGRNVLLVETNLQEPVLADDFGLERSPGLANCLRNGHSFESGCRATFLENLHLLPAGESDATAGRLLRSSRMLAELDAMRETYDIVVLDMPAILANSDALVLTDAVDSVIFVVRAGVTPATVVNRALELVEPSKLRGMVLNGTKSAVPGWIQRLTRRSD